MEEGESESESEEEKERRHGVFLREREREVCWEMGFEIWRELCSFWQLRWGVRIAHTTTATGWLVSVVTVTLGILGLESLI